MTFKYFSILKTERQVFSAGKHWIFIKLKCHDLVSFCNKIMGFFKPFLNAEQYFYKYDDWKIKISIFKKIEIKRKFIAHLSLSFQNIKKYSFSGSLAGNVSYYCLYPQRKKLFRKALSVMS